MVQEFMSLKLPGGFVTARAEAFASSQYKSADGWIG
jgi:hypothetical protein